MRSPVLQRAPVVASRSSLRSLIQAYPFISSHWIKFTQSLNMSSAAGSQPTFESVGVKNTDIKQAAGVDLSAHQKVLVGSVLDLFEGHPSLKHLALWQPTATFQDPIALAQGRDKFAAQWYGLTALFKPITILSHEVTSSGNPITLSLSNKYVVKGIKTEKIMNSVIEIQVADDGLIEKVTDRWNDKLPEGAFSEAFRKLNAVTTPLLVKVPKTDEEDQKLKQERGD